MHLLKSVTKPQLKKAMGLAGYKDDSKVFEKLFNQLRDHGTLATLGGQGRKPVYTDEMLDAALTLVTSSKDQKYNKQQLLNACVPNPAGHSAKAFMRKLKAHARRKGMRLASTTRAVLNIPPSLQWKRYWWSNRLLMKLKRRKLVLSAIAFTDETAIQSEPHPKSKLLCTFLLLVI